MTTDQPTPPGSVHPTYWQLPSATPDSDLLPRLRARLVAVVAALLVQAAIAVLGVLPALPGVLPLNAGDPYSYGRNPVSFWAQFAVVEFIAALVVSSAFGPVVRLRDVPIAGRVVMAFAFIIVPAIAIGLGGIDAARAAAGAGSEAVASSWLSTAFFTTMFFGLPLLVLGATPTADRRR